MKKINLWLIRQDYGEKWKWHEDYHGHPCRDLTKYVSECLGKEAKKREKAKLGNDSTFDLIALFINPALTPDERDLMMDCACAIDDRLRKETGLKLASISCLDDCDWVRWFTAEDLKRHRKNQKKLNKERNEK